MHLFLDVLTVYLFLDVQGVWREQVMNVFLTVYLFVDVQGVWRGPRAGDERVGPGPCVGAGLVSGPV